MHVLGLLDGPKASEQMRLASYGFTEDDELFADESSRRAVYRLHSSRDPMLLRLSKYDDSIRTRETSYLLYDRTVSHLSLYSVGNGSLNYKGWGL